MDKIDIHNSEKSYEQAVQLLKKDISATNYKLIKKFLDASAIGKTARKKARKKQVNVRARLKNLYLLKITAKFMKKDLSKVTQKDMERWIRALNKDEIYYTKKTKDKKKTIKKVNYSEQTKANIKASFIQFLRYTLTSKKKFSDLTDWIDTSFKEVEIPALKEEEIRKLLSKCYTLQQKVLIALLFDSGSRIEEFLNLRFSDITEVKGDIPYYKLTIRNETSKTNGRTIGLFWKPTTEILRQWKEENKEKNNNELIFPSTYDGVRKVLYKIGKRALGKSVNPHLFRHSSATYYASKDLEYFQMCKRYGWRIGSDMPHRYIDRAGIKEKEFAGKIINENIQDLNEKYEKLIHEGNLNKEEVCSLREELSDIRQMLNKLNRRKK